MKREKIWQQQGTQPVLIISPDCDTMTRVPIVLPVTSRGSFARCFADGAGTRTTGVVRCDQTRPIDLVARKARLLENVPAHVMDEVLARLAPMFCE